MRIILLFILSFFYLFLDAQETGSYVAAAAGLNMREKPDVSAKLVDKIPYGSKISLVQTEESLGRASVEGFSGYWKKVTFGQKTGYVIDIYLSPVAPPALGTKTLKEYLLQLSPLFGDTLVVKKQYAEYADEGGSTLTKQLYKNGAEWHDFDGYEYGSMTYFLPGFTIQQAYLLTRMIPEFREYIGDRDEFITSGKKIKKRGREYEYKVEKEVFGDTPWINRIKIGFEEGAIYEFELYQIDDQVVIFYSSGV